MTSKAFILRRLHSLMGLLIVIYLVEHLTVNSQAALWLKEDGIGFIKLVNFIHSLPYLQVIEVLLIGVPITFHAVLGIKYALTSKGNSRSSKGNKPSLKEGRNIAFSWQRITAWILIIGIFAHVVHMRFLEKPKQVMVENKEQFLVKLNFDTGLYTLSERLHVLLYGPKQIHAMDLFNSVDSPNRWTSSKAVPYNSEMNTEKQGIQNRIQEKKWINALLSFSLKDTQVVAVADNSGTAFLLMVRNAFKNPILAIIYSLFVLSAAYHAFNGMWTAMITWGAILSYRSQKAMINVAIACMILIGGLGLIAIWGSYWINLRS